MKTRSIIIALAIVLVPFIIGVPLYFVKSSAAMHVTAHCLTDTRDSNKGITYKGIKVDWIFCPDWEYKSLLFPAEEYLVFMFHYTNNSEHDVQLMPSYTFASPGNRRYSANEEIAMYIEDEAENTFKAEDQTAMTFKIRPSTTKHDLVTFEKPGSFDHFYVDVDVFRDVTLRLHYKNEDGRWINHSNELVNEYKGRG